jgi:hypothetical protein
VERISDHALYDVENLAKSDEGRKKWQIREEKLLRDRRAKAQLARWYKTKYPEKVKSPTKGSERATKGGTSIAGGDPSSREPSIIASSVSGSVEGFNRKHTSVSISTSRSTVRSIGSQAKTPSRIVGSRSSSQSRSPHRQRVVAAASATGTADKGPKGYVAGSGERDVESISVAACDGLSVSDGHDQQRLQSNLEVLPSSDGF